MFTDDQRYLLREQARRISTTCYRDRVLQGLFLRQARDDEERAFLMAVLIDARASWKAGETATQRKWQSRVSRRPSRVNHHDSWALREQYVRGGSYHDYLPTPGAPVRP